MSFSQKMEELEIRADKHLKKMDRQLTRITLGLRFLALALAISQLVTCIEDFSKNDWLGFDVHIFCFLIWFAYSLALFDSWKSVKLIKTAFPNVDPTSLKSETLTNLCLRDRVLMIIKLNAFQFAEVNMDSETARKTGQELVAMGLKIQKREEAQQ